jgi:vacuolar-type H+-ATPase subunit D/Vma8
MVNMRKILEIKKGEYLLELITNKGVITSVKTTYNQNFALNIADMSLEQVGFLVENFKKVGYTKCKIVTIEPIGGVAVPTLKVIADSTKETSEKIGKALKEVKERVTDEV